MFDTLISLIALLSVIGSIAVAILVACILHILRII